MTRWFQYLDKRCWQFVKFPSNQCKGKILTFDLFLDCFCGIQPLLFKRKKKRNWNINNSLSNICHAKKNTHFFTKIIWEKTSRLRILGKQPSLCWILWTHGTSGIQHFLCLTSRHSLTHSYELSQNQSFGFSFVIWSKLRLRNLRFRTHIWKYP